MCIRDSYSTPPMRGLLLKQKNSHCYTPKRIGEDIVPTTPRLLLNTSWVNYPPSSATKAAPERDYWTSLFKIPTP